MEQCSVLITSLTTALHGNKKEEIKQKLRFLSSHHMTITVSISMVYLHKVIICNISYSSGLEKEKYFVEYFTNV